MIIKAIIFDFAGVVATEGYIAWLSENIDDFKKTKQFYLDLSYKSDSGLISSDEFTAVLAQKSGIAKKEIWPQIFNKIIINPQMLKLLKKLRKKYQLGLLTNHINEWISFVIDYYQLTDYFDEIVISSKEKIIKPNPKIFKIMLNRLGVQPEESIFIDDRKINLYGANKIGIKDLLFTTEEKLVADLKKLEII